MSYKCSQCDNVADQAGDCCNVPMNEDKEEKVEEAKEAVQETSENSTDEQAQ